MLKIHPKIRSIYIMMLKSEYMHTWSDLEAIRAMINGNRNNPGRTFIVANRAKGLVDLDLSDDILDYLKS